MLVEKVSSWAGVRRRIRTALLRLQPLMLPQSWVIARVRAGPGKIALTFDDGPDPAFTPRLLDILECCGVPASLFFIGQAASAYPSLVRDAVTCGHQVSNHGFDHSVKPRQGWSSYLDNILRGEEALLDVCPAASVSFFRPPHGIFPKRLLPWAVRHGRTIALWSIDSGDSFGGGETVLETTQPQHIRAGDVVLFHEDQCETIDVLAEVIGRLYQAGYTFATLREFTK